MDEKETLSFEEIKLMLERLKALDTSFRVFGAYQHQYKNHPLSDDELEKWENDLGVRLPADYREFLQKIGYGAGPYYGLLGPEEILDEMKEGYGFTPPSANKPFPFDLQQAEECFQIMSEEREVRFLTAFPTDGCIPISFEGCSFFTYLVTAGELTGILWSHSLDTLEEEYILSIGLNLPAKPPGREEVEVWWDSWNLATQPPGIASLRSFNYESAWEQALSPLPTFLEWYSSWLQQCILDCEEFKVEVSRRTEIQPTVKVDKVSISSTNQTRRIKSFIKRIIGGLKN